MSLLPFHMDRKRQGTHYSDRLHRILGACQRCGVRQIEERVRYRDGHVEPHMQTLVRPYTSKESGERDHAVVVVTAQYEKYALSVDPRVLTKVRSMGPQFALALNVTSASIEVDGDTVWIRVPIERTGDLTYEQARALAVVPPGALLLGQCDDGAQAALGLGGQSSNVHCAVIGMSGSGKSTLLRTMAISALQNGQRVALLDLSDGMHVLSGHPGVWCGGDFETPERCAQALAYLAERILRRESFGLLYVFVDEAPALVHAQKGAAQSLGAIAATGRHSGVHLIVGAQHATSDTVGGIALANISATVMGKVRNPLAAYTGAGHSGTGAHLLQGHGDMIVVKGEQTTHIQAAIPDGDFIRRWASQYPPRYGQLPQIVRAQTVAPIVQVAPSPAGDGEPGRPMEDPSREMIEWCVSWMRRHGEPPSLTKIMTQAQRRYAQGGYNRPKSYRTIARATALFRRRYGDLPGAAEILARAQAKISRGEATYGSPAL